MNEIFATASRLKLRYDTPQGKLSTEDLWDLPLTSSRPNQANLDDIAIELDRKVKDTSTTSFVKKAAKPNDDNKIKFDIVLHIIEVRQAEAEAAELKKANAQKKQRILEILANKKDEALAGKSIEELEAIAATM